MKRKRIEGKTLIKALIDIDGSVLYTVIIESSGYGEFDFTALSAGLKYEFTPAMQDDRCVRVWVAIPFLFRLH
jgi:protein TonB